MILKEKVYFTPSQSERGLHIYLPDDYQTSGKRYPVMYYFDGHNLFYDSDATYGKSWGLKVFLDHYSKEFIVVGLECSHVGNERLVEYCPYHYQGKFWGDLHGRGKETLDWMVNTLKPMIDARFPTYVHREATGICGSSMGGLMALYGVIAHNDVFSKAGCLSSAIGPGIKNLCADIESHAIDANTRVYLSIGEKEASSLPVKNIYATVMARSAKKVTKLLETKGVNTAIYIQKDGRHCEADWEKQNKLYFDYLWCNQKSF